MKVLHVGEYVKGGVATYINEVVSYQSKCKDIDEVHLVLSKKNSESSYEMDINNIHFYEYLRKPNYFISTIRKIHEIINEIKPDIIHVHSTFAGLFVRLPLLLKVKRPKIIYCSHGWSFLMETTKLKKFIYSIIEKILSYKTDLIINISSNEHEKSFEYGLPKNKSVVIYNGLREASNLDGPVDLELDAKKLNLLFVGRYDRQKGLDVLLSFFKTYKSDKVKLYIIGGGILANQDIEIPNNIENIGWIDNSKLNSYYQKFDAVIVPSRWEGFGLVAVEAMRNRKAVIVSNRGALPELIDDGQNGYVFDLEDLSTLEMILNNIEKSKLKDLGENGYLKFKREFTSDIMNHKIIGEYSKLF